MESADVYVRLLDGRAERPRGAGDLAAQFVSQAVDCAMELGPEL